MTYYATPFQLIAVVRIWISPPWLFLIVIYQTKYPDIPQNRFQIPYILHFKLSKYIDYPF